LNLKTAIGFRIRHGGAAGNAASLGRENHAHNLMRLFRGQGWPRSRRRRASPLGWAVINRAFGPAITSDCTLFRLKFKIYVAKDTKI